MLLPIVGALLGKGVDARWLMMIGLLLMGLGNYWLSILNLDIGPWQVVWPRVVLILGLSFLFAPLNVAAYQGISPELRGAAVGLLSLLRNEGGSVGTSVAQTIQERREQFHLLRLNEYLDMFNPAFKSYLNNLRPGLLQNFGDPALADQLGYQILDNTRQQQAQSLSYFDVYWVFGALALLLIPLVLIMKRSVAAKGEPISSE
jgi:DHA2 family multidrug resistance protein